MGGEFTYQPKWDPIGFEPQPFLCLLRGFFPKGSLTARAEPRRQRHALETGVIGMPEVPQVGSLVKRTFEASSVLFGGFEAH